MVEGAAVALTLATLVTAQNPSGVQEVSPRGYATREGPYANTTSYFNFAAGGIYQQVHGDMQNGARMFSGIAHRRDGATGTTASAAARFMELTITFGHGNIDTFSSSSFAGNMLNLTGTANDPTVVADEQLYSFPNLSTAPTSFPTPFDVVVPTNAYAYTGAHDFVWQVNVDSNTRASSAYPLDAADLVTISSTVQVLNPGCVASGQSSPFTLDSDPANFQANSLGVFRYDFELTNAPPTEPTWVLWGTTDPNVLLPGVCTHLRTSPTVIIPTGTSSVLGATSRTVRTGFSNSYQGLQVYVQPIAPDAGQFGLPWVLGSGLQITLPGGLPPVAPVKSLYQTTSTGTRTFGMPGATAPLVTQFHTP
jgi:hypothetical protein